MTRPTGSGSLDLLAGRARKGDRRAAAQLRRRMTPQVRELARALAADPRAVPVVVRHALHDALRDDQRPYTSALVAAVQRRSAGRLGLVRDDERSAESRLLRAVGVLCDMQGHTHSAAAALLGEPVARVAALHAQGRSELGVDRSRTDCRGWHLVSRLAELTPPEQEAGGRHLDACRPCQDALAARAAARTRLKAALPVGGTVLGGGVAALLAAIGGGSATAGAAAVGAAAVLGTAGTVAVATPPAPPPPPPPATSVGTSVEDPARDEPAVDRTGPAAPLDQADPVDPALPLPLPDAPAPAGEPVTGPAPAPTQPPGGPVPGLPVPVPVPVPTLPGLPDPSDAPSPPLPPPPTDPPTVEVPLPGPSDVPLLPLVPLPQPPLAVELDPVAPALEVAAPLVGTIPVVETLAPALDAVAPALQTVLPVLGGHVLP